MLHGPTELFWYNPGGMVSPVFLQYCDFFELAMRNATICDGKICLVIYRPASSLTHLRQPSLVSNYAVNLLTWSFWALFKCPLSWNDFKQLLDNVFMHNTPLRDILSIFLQASKVILDAVFLYFRSLAFAIDIFALQYMSGKNNDSSKSRLACFTAKRNCAVPHQTICSAKSDSTALATFQNVGKTGKQEAIWNKCVGVGPTLFVFS